METLQKRQKIRNLPGRKAGKSDFDRALAHLGVHIQLQQNLTIKK